MALAAIADGQSRAEAAAIGLMDRQTLRVIRFNAEGPAGLIDRSSPGRPPKLRPAQKQEMRQWLEEGPGPHDPRLVRWRCADLAGVIRDRFGLVCPPTTIGRMLRELGVSHVSPRHPEKDMTMRQKSLKKLCRAGERTPSGTAVGHAGGDLVPR
jgi:transposase